MFGQPGFFAPRVPTHWLFGGKVTSYYDTCGLKIDTSLFRALIEELR